MGTKGNQMTGRCCVIIGAGDIADYDGVLRRMPPGSQVVCADGGYLHCQSLGVLPEILVGDFDSLKEVPKDIMQVNHPAEKNYTDLALAVEEAMESGFTRIMLAGVLGGRLDHTLANLQVLGWCATQGVEAWATDGSTDIYCLHARGRSDAMLELEPREDCYFSLVSLVEQCEGVTIRDAKYLLNRYSLRSLESPRAISNEFCGKPVQILMEKGTLLVTVVPMDRHE